MTDVMTLVAAVLGGGVLGPIVTSGFAWARARMKRDESEAERVWKRVGELETRLDESSEAREQQAAVISQAVAEVDRISRERDACEATCEELRRQIATLRTEAARMRARVDELDRRTTPAPFPGPDPEPT